MKLKIIDIVILRGQYGPDKLLFQTEIPSAQWPFKGTQDLYTDVATGQGEMFCKENFPGVPFKVKEV